MTDSINSEYEVIFMMNTGFATNPFAALIMAVVMAFSSFAGMGEASVEAEYPTEVPVTETDDVLFLPEGTNYGDTVSVFVSYNIYDNDFIADAEAGEDISDAVFHRNLIIEERFGTKLEFAGSYTGSATAEPVIRILIQAGDDTYDAFICNNSKISPLVYEGMFVDWQDIPYVNLQNSWWNAKLNDSINFGGKYYAVTGAYNLHNLKETSCLIFNKTMMDDLSLEYPYDLVRDGAWTIDEFTSMVKAAYRDINGDGVMSPEQDIYGFSGQKLDMVSALWAGMGGDAVIADENNLPILNIDNQTNYDIIDKMVMLFSGGAYDGDVTYGTANTLFGESRLLFADTTLGAIPDYRKAPEPYGIVPYPKLNAEQKEYRSRVDKNTSVTLIPVTNNNLALTGAVFEYMAYLSDKEIAPLFTDLELMIKSTYDIDSEEMIQLIKESTVLVDEDYLTAQALGTMASEGENTLASYCAMSSGEWSKKLESYVEFWKE